MAGRATSMAGERQLPPSPVRHGQPAAGDGSAPTDLSPAAFSFLAVYRPTSQQVRIYPIGLDAPFDGPIDLSEAAAHSLMAELRTALHTQDLAAQLLGARLLDGGAV